jgi:hypothetical protein
VQPFGPHDRSGLPASSPRRSTEEQQRWENQAKANHDRIRSELDSLSNGHWSNLQRDFRGFFEHSRRILDLFKTLKPLRREDREKLWNRYRTLCDEAARKRDHERQNFEASSESEKRLIVARAREARTYAAAATTGDDFRQASQQLAGARDRLREAKDKLTRSHSSECWEALNEAHKALHDARFNRWSLNYSLAKDAVGAAVNAIHYASKPHDALVGLKEARARTKGLYLNREQAEHIRREFDALWDKVKAQMDERRRANEQKHTEWQSRQRDNLARWDERVSRLQDTVRRLNDQVRELEDKRRSARSVDFERRVSDWIDEKLRKTSDIESTIRELERRIDDVRGKLGH